MATRADAQTTPPTANSFKSLNEQLTFTAPTTVATSTTATTTTPSATGSLEAINHNGKYGGILLIEATGFAAGTYSVSATKVSDKSTVVLGSLTIGANGTTGNGNGGDDGNGDGEGDGHGGNGGLGGDQGSSGGGHSDHRGGNGDHHEFDGGDFHPGGGTAPTGGTTTTSNTTGSTVTETHAREGECHFEMGSAQGLPFPAGFNPFDIASVTISDSTNAVVLTSSATPIENGCLIARASLTAGTVAPTAQGGASVAIRIKGGVATGGIILHAHNLPASAAYTYSVNGTDIGPVTTTATGHLALRSFTNGKVNPLPTTIDLLSITSIVVHDGTGAVVVSATF
jgi:hypothetical protein